MFGPGASTMASAQSAIPVAAVNEIGQLTRINMRPLWCNSTRRRKPIALGIRT